MKSILVLFGGVSAEKDISVITGVMTANNIDDSKYAVIPVYIDKTGLWYTSNLLLDVAFYQNIEIEKLQRVTLMAGDDRLFYVKKEKKLKPIEHIACAINCLHGIGGEDGSVAGLLQLCNIPLASPDVASSSISMDKYLTKLFLKGLNVKTLPYRLFKAGEQIAERDLLKYPLIVKPVRQGSSIGIGKAENFEQLAKCVFVAKQYDGNIIVEKCLEDFMEINVAVYKIDGKIKVSELEQPLYKQDFLSFDDKYNNGERIFPANVKPELKSEIVSVAKKVYAGLNFNGIIRIDFLIKNESVYVNEINSVPGSLSCYLISDTFGEFSKVIDKVIMQTEKDFNALQSTKKEYSSSILSSAGAKGAKKGCKK